MRAIRRFTVRTALPGPLAPLHELIFNLWWSWHPASRRLLTRWSMTLVTCRVQLSLPTARVATCVEVISEGGRSTAGGADSTASRTPSWSAVRPTRDPAGAKRAAGEPSNTFERGPSVPASAPAPPETVTSQVPPRR